MNKKFGLHKKLFVVLTLFNCFVMMSACGQQEKYHTTDSNEYLKTQGHITNEGTDIRSGLFIFPESIENHENSEYEYYCKRGVLDNSYMIFLKTSYTNKEAYELELKRIADISCSINTSAGTILNKIQYAEDLFEYPAYVTIYNTNMSFEYALIDEENNSVIYVYLKLCEGADYLPDKYLPTEFNGKSMLQYDTSWTNQNIYYAPDGEGTHIYYLD